MRKGFPRQPLESWTHLRSHPPPPRGPGRAAGGGGRAARGADVRAGEAVTRAPENPEIPDPPPLRTCAGVEKGIDPDSPPPPEKRMAIRCLHGFSVEQESGSGAWLKHLRRPAGAAPRRPAPPRPTNPRGGGGYDVRVKVLPALPATRHPSRPPAAGPPRSARGRVRVRAMCALAVPPPLRRAPRWTTAAGARSWRRPCAGWCTTWPGEQGMPAPRPRHARATPAPLIPNRSLWPAPRPRHARATFLFSEGNSTWPRGTTTALWLYRAAT
eukprot:gene16562-biopygen747